MIIAIDGPAASGKSTTSRGVATRMGITYLDTGAMYRAITLGLMEHGVSFKDLSAITEFLDTVNIYFGDSNSVNNIFLNDKSVTNQIRSSTVTENVSEVSAINVVRDSMVQIQREIADNIDCVLEGRDIGTVVFPNADFKFFLVAGAKKPKGGRFDPPSNVLILKISYPFLQEVCYIQNVFYQFHFVYINILSTF